MGRHKATGLVEGCIRTFRERLMAFSSQSPKPGLRVALNEVLYSIRTAVHQLLGCTPFEAHFGRRPNTIWYSITRASSTESLTWKNMLFSLDRNEKMFPAKVMQSYGEPDDATNPLVSGMTVPKLAEETTSAPVLQAQANVYKLFLKIHDRLKSEPYFVPQRERIVRKRLILFSGKIFHKCDISMSLGDWVEEAGGLKAVSLSGTTNYEIFKLIGIPKRQPRWLALNKARDNLGNQQWITPATLRRIRS